jgi:hypothetical protein
MQFALPSKVSILPVARTPANSSGLLDSRLPSSTEMPMRLIELAVVLAVSVILARFAVLGHPDHLFSIGIVA